jgi:hypothetical protein
LQPELAYLMWLGSGTHLAHAVVMQHVGQAADLVVELLVADLQIQVEM